MIRKVLAMDSARLGADICGGFLLCGYLWVAVFGESKSPVEPAPTPSITAKGKILSVRDGDTLKVEVKFVADVRLLSCWAPELKTGAPGIASRENLKALAEGKDCIVQVPLTSDNIGRATSMGRILGRVFVDGKDVSAEQVKAGFATKAKEE